MAPGDTKRRKLDRKVPRHHLQTALAGAIGRKMREREVLVDGADVDDFARSLAALEMLHKCLAGKKRPLQIRTKDKIISRLRHFPERGVFFYPGVVDQNIELAEPRDASVHELIDVGHGTEVRADGHRAAAQTLDLRLHLIGFSRMRMVINHDICALLGKTDGDGLPDALAAACNECDFAGEFHKNAFR
jgi:hypothetical protein